MPRKPSAMQPSSAALTPSAKPNIGNHSDLVVVLGLALVAAALALLATAVPQLAALLLLPRMLIGGLATFLLPGYAITQALFLRRTMDWIGLVLFIGLSLFTTIIGAFIINLAPGGIRTETWVIYLLGVTWIASYVAYLRRGRRAAPSTPPDAHTTRAAISGSQIVLLCVAGAIAMGAYFWARENALESSKLLAPTLQMWLLPAAQPNEVRVGLQNMHLPSDEDTFIVRVQHNGNLLCEWPQVQVLPGATWEARCRIPIETANTPGPLEALAYRASAPQFEFRRVSLWPK